jgi:hypothetical protein
MPPGVGTSHPVRQQHPEHFTEAIVPMLDRVTAE